LEILLTDLISFQARARNSLGLLFVEFAFVAGLFVADVYHHIFFSKTPYLFLLGWASLRLRGMRWKDVGFARPKSWGQAKPVNVCAALARRVRAIPTLKSARLKNRN
jgi:hypothetical protein